MILRLALCVGALALGLGSALADDTCASRATEKKLAGAALKSFTTKCQKDAAAACDASATTKKLFGAAKTSFTKKCVTDAVGN